MKCEKGKREWEKAKKKKCQFVGKYLTTSLQHLNQSTMLSALLFLLTLLCLSLTQATHVEIYRDFGDNGRLLASIYRTEEEENAYSYNTENDFVVMFDDITTVMLEKAFDDMVYVTVNQRHLYTCFFPAQSPDEMLHVMHIFKEEDRLKIAEAANTVCFSTNKMTVREKITKRRYEKTPLRHQVF